MASGFRKHSPVIIYFVVASIVTMVILWSIANRINYISHMKSQINTMISNINEMGFDFAYDNFSTSYIPFTKAIKFENFRIYNLYEGEEFALNLGDMSISTPFINHNKISISLGGEQHLITKRDDLIVAIKSISIYSEYRNKKMKKISIETGDVYINKLMNIGNLKIDLSKVDDGQNIAKIDTLITNVKIDDSLSFPLIRNIDKLALNLEIPIGFKLRANNSKIYIDKAIVKWDPLLLVGKGNIYMNADGLDIRLNTTSKGLFETLEMINQAKLLDEDSFEILKIMIETESYKLRPEDKYNTTTTSIRYKSSQVSINSVPICKQQ